MSVDLSGKTALVTGASRGIGAAVAKGLAGAGAHVILLARTQSGLEAVDDEIRAAGGSATLIPMDLRRLEKVDQLGPSILERFGGLDILVGHAGMLGPLTPAHQVSPKDWQKVMSVNFEANVRLVHTLDPLLRNADQGRIVFTTAGDYAVDGLAYWGPYMASKAALNVFAKTYAQEVRRTNMKINLLYPGPVDTAMLREAFPGKIKIKTKQPEDLVDDYLRLVSDTCDQHGDLVKIK
ncbi:MAG: SDR family NAD(P)-dependent oxidoreductase [Alphaproteobacteria bacterium]|nr:SDR family NAD(P)-dependent oxidoreductase [Alphaproteobacteria bacterium]